MITHREEEAVLHFLIHEKRYFRGSNNNEISGSCYKTNGTPLLTKTLLEKIVKQAILSSVVLGRPTTKKEVETIIKNFFNTAKDSIKF